MEIILGSYPSSKDNYIHPVKIMQKWMGTYVGSWNQECKWKFVPLSMVQGDFRLCRIEKEKLWCSASSPPLLKAPNPVAHWCIFFLQDSLQGKPDWADLMVTAKDFWADKQRPPWILCSDFLHNRLLCQPILDILQSLFLQLFKQGIAGTGTVLTWQAWCVCELQIYCLEKKLKTIFTPL